VTPFIESRSPDLLWVIGLSQLVPDSLIRLAKQGGVGFHPTLLPEGRGRAPVAWTILRNARAAATLFYLCDEPDAGDIITQREVPVLPDDYSQDLIRRTNTVLADAILELAPRIRSNNLPRTPQNHTQATYYPKRTPADGLIDWHAPTDHVYRLIRAAGRPYPGAFTYTPTHKLTVWRAHPVPRPPSPPPSPPPPPARILDISPTDGILVATPDAALRLTEIETEPSDNAFNVLSVDDRFTPHPPSR